MKKIFILFITILLCACNSNKTFDNVDVNSINEFDYSEIKQFDFPINSNKYLLVRTSDLKVLYEKDSDKKMYPASLTKLLTLDTVLHLVDDLNDVSSFTSKQYEDLIFEDASLANLKVDYEYSILDLLNALILPSGADAAVALENYFSNKNIDLVEQMNILKDSLGCSNSNFVNTTGLHDDNHYTTLNDLFKILWDVLSYKQARIILETLDYRLTDGQLINSTVKPIKASNVIVMGGKTGYTPESGQSITVLYSKNNRSYILMVANADRKSYEEHLHYDDAIEIFKELY